MPDHPVIGAYVPARDWQSWDHQQTRQELAALKAFGINTFVTEADTYPDDLIDLVHQTDMRFFGGIACFMNHGDILQGRPALWPVLETGDRRPQMEWYIGVTPTNATYRAERLRVVEQIVAAHALDGFILDFVRWPLHWEQELRPGAPPPPDSSFDPETIRQFLADADLAMPDTHETTAQQARWILDHHRAQWVDFKCRVITSFVSDIRQRVGSLTLGAYIVPAPEAQRAQLVGQRLHDLAPLLDFAAPMVYHAILHRPPPWVGQISREVAQFAPVLPVVQVRAADGLENDADWGPPISAVEWRQVLDDIDGDMQGVIAFTAPLLKRENRGEILRDWLSQASRARSSDD